VASLDVAGFSGECQPPAAFSGTSCELAAFSGDVAPHPAFSGRC